MTKNLFSLFFVFTLFGALLSQTSKVYADSSEPITFTSRVTLYSPVNTTYSTKFLTLNLTAQVGIAINCTITYSIDNKHQGTVPLKEVYPDELHVITQVKGNVALPELTQGTHNLTLQVVCTLNNGEGSATMDRYPFIPECDNITNYHATWTDTLQFTIQTDQQIPEFPTAIIFPLLLTSALIIMVTCRRKL
ncbi:MAG: hypothetical protein NWF02_01045 [Candidatus Bathyarchaeota archaeon]|nr:hypothetical protein [Candidatus Bathyarchaeum sp.]